MARSKEERLKALLEKFRALAPERLEKMNAAWLTLERTPDAPEAAAELLREIHTLKGEARAVGLADANAVAHRTEDVLQLVARAGWRVGSETFSAVLGAFDLLERIIGVTRGRRRASRRRWTASTGRSPGSPRAPRPRPLAPAAPSAPSPARPSAPEPEAVGRRRDAGGDLAGAGVPRRPALRVDGPGAGAGPSAPPRAGGADGRRGGRPRGLGGGAPAGEPARPRWSTSSTCSSARWSPRCAACAWCRCRCSSPACPAWSATWRCRWARR